MAHAGTLRLLLPRFETAAALCAAPAAQLSALGASPKLIGHLAHPDPFAIDADLRWLDHEQHHFIPWQDARYPALLREVPDAPTALYVRGNIDCLCQPQLAMVGSRNPTPSGRDIAFEFAGELARCGLVITSGLAIGIDAACHRGAIAAQGLTVAVCGTGLDVIYPRSHDALADQIASHGALVSEFPLGTRALKLNFPRRNRIISGLALGTLVVEAALKSGSLITARLAAEQGREVFAIPGSIRNPIARGCHQLIREGTKLVESIEDVFSELGPLSVTLTRTREIPASAGSTTPDRALDKEYEILLDALGFELASVDQLVGRTGLKSGAVASMLLILELDGRVESHPGGVYVRTRPEAAK
jgi:DNA processing protein